MTDLRYALRTLHSSPGFALAVVLVLGLGLGDPVEALRTE